MYIGGEVHYTASVQRCNRAIIALNLRAEEQNNFDFIMGVLRKVHTKYIESFRTELCPYIPANQQARHLYPRAPRLEHEKEKKGGAAALSNISTTICQLVAAKHRGPSAQRHPYLPFFQQRKRH